MSKKIFSLTIAAVSVAALIPASLPAQSIWLDHRHHSTINLEVLIPNFKNDDSGTITSSNSGWVVFPSVRLPLSRKIHFVGELPLASGHYEVKSTSFNINRNQSETAIGNPYIGFEFSTPQTPVFAELGIRLPLASSDKDLSMTTGLLTDFDRLEAFFPKVLTITTMVNVHQIDQSGFALRVRGGPSLLINTDNEFDDDTELFIGYSAQAGYESERLSFLGGVTGRAILTEPNLNFSERSVHQAGFAASAGIGKLRPGLHLRLPLDENLKDSLDFVLGFTLGIQLQ